MVHAFIMCTGMYKAEVFSHHVCNFLCLHYTGGRNIKLSLYAITYEVKMHILLFTVAGIDVWYICNFSTMKSLHCIDVYETQQSL